MTMDSEYLKETLLPTLHWLLSKRLSYSRSWNNVRVVEKKKTFSIEWIEPKKTDPEGKRTFKSMILPLSNRSLDGEIERQIVKYVKDKYGVELDVGV